MQEVETRNATETCDFLGNEDDPKNKSSIPWPGHRCYAMGSPSSIERVHQGLFCLTGEHKNCPRYALGRGLRGLGAEMDAKPKPAKKNPVASLPKLAIPATNTLLKLALIAAVVTLVIALDFAVLRPIGRDAALSEPMPTSAIQTTTYTLFPPTATPTTAPPPTMTPPALTRPANTTQQVQPITQQPIQQPAPQQPALQQPAPTVTPIPTARTIAPTRTPAEPAKITLQPGGGPVASTFTLMGSNWQPNADVSIRWGASQSLQTMAALASARTTGGGAFSATISVPAGAKGIIYLSVLQDNQVAYVPFVVTP